MIVTPASQKVALITGAARGIGLATAKRFLTEGWRVGLLDIDGDTLRNAVASLADAGRTMALECDVSDAKAVAASIDKVARQFGRLDALINNAGVAVFASVMETSDEDWLIRHVKVPRGRSRTLSGRLVVALNANTEGRGARRR